AGRPETVRVPARDSGQRPARESGKASTGQRRSTPVVSASYSEPSIAAEEVVPNEYGDHQFAAMDEGMTYLDSGDYSDFGAGSFESGGCGEPGCDSCGSYSAVAPTCTS